MSYELHAPPANPLPLIVPLGGNCFPRWCATLLGFKPRKADGEPSFPFDAGIFPLQMVRDLVESDFAGMADPANLIVREAPGGYQVLSDRRYLIGTYNHEMAPATDTDFVANNFAGFVERYERRIAALRSRVAMAPEVVLFLSVSNLTDAEEPPASYADFEAILTAFEARYPATRFRLFVVIERFQNQIPDSWNGRIRVFNFQMRGPYTKFIMPLIYAIARQNALGSVVHSFGHPVPPPTLPDPAIVMAVTRSALQASFLAHLLDTPLPALMRSQTPLGNAARAFAGLLPQPLALMG